jgi:predicted esterase
VSIDLRLPRVRSVGSPRGVSQLGGVLLHGRGKTPEEKIDLAARFGNIEGIRWVVPEAETPGSWYPGRFWDPREVNQPYLDEAIERCHEAVLEASESGRLGSERLVIVGFSQGACLALEYALRHPGRVGSLIVFTGALLGVPGSDWKATAPRSLAGLRVLLTGSDVDDWVPEEYSRSR